jgi:TPR repeat protein
MFEIAAAMGLPAALNNLARMHDLGQIPDARPAEAERLYARAAATGNPHAPRHLARLLGRSPERAKAEATRIAALLDLAAARGTALSVEPPPPPDLDFWPRPLTLGDLPWIRLGREDARPSDAETSLSGPVVSSTAMSSPSRTPGRSRPIRSCCARARLSPTRPATR